MKKTQMMREAKEKISIVVEIEKTEEIRGTTETIQRVNLIINNRWINITKCLKEEDYNAIWEEIK